jgi:HK97 family phage portal protein
MQYTYPFKPGGFENASGEHVEKINIGYPSRRSRIRSLIEYTYTQIKQLVWRFSYYNVQNMFQGRSTYDYSVDVGDTRNNSIIVACLNLISTSFIEAPIIVQDITNPSPSTVPNHDLVKLIRRPNPYYSGELMLMATVCDWMFGNSQKQLVGLWWIPSTLIRPVGSEDGKIFVEKYEYTPAGTPIDYKPEDIIHFRNGMDPNNPRLGLNPLGALLREVATDEEAANYVSAMLRNLGPPGVIINPKGDFRIKKEDREEIKAEIMQRFSGDKRGQPMVLGGDTNVHVLSFTPEQMNLRALRQVSEERITAVFGVHAIVVALGAGLARSTFTNYGEARTAFMEQRMVPTWTLFDADITKDLLPEFETAPDNFRVKHDISNVRALQPDQTELINRLTKLSTTGHLSINEVRIRAGEQPIEGGDVHLVPMNLIPMLPGDMVNSPQAVNLMGDSSDGEPLPEAANRTGNFDTKAFNDSIDRIRARFESMLADELTTFLDQQRSRVIDSSKARFTFNLTDEIARLTKALQPWYRRVMISVHDLVQQVVGNEYEISDSLMQKYLKAAGVDIRGITEVTRDAVRQVFKDNPNTTEAITALRNLPEFSPTRAKTIAITEIAKATNLASLASYKQSGVVKGVRILDGDIDERCETLNGKRFTLEQAANIPILGHPNCRRQFLPITNADELAA